MRKKYIFSPDIKFGPVRHQHLAFGRRSKFRCRFGTGRRWKWSLLLHRRDHLPPGRFHSVCHYFVFRMHGGKEQEQMHAWFGE